MKIILIILAVMAISFIPAILKTIRQYSKGIICVNCNKRTRDFSVDRDGKTYCRQCWFNKTGKQTTI